MVKNPHLCGFSNGELKCERSISHCKVYNDYKIETPLIFVFQYLPLMQGKSLAMIFEKRSTRTRLSAETGRSEQWHSQILYEIWYGEYILGNTAQFCIIWQFANCANFALPCMSMSQHITEISSDHSKT